jgi:hypothetical protein
MGIQSMQKSKDGIYADKARVHIIAAEAAPRRADFELTQAENFARLIRDGRLRDTVRREIRKARGR